MDFFIHCSYYFGLGRVPPPPYWNWNLNSRCTVNVTVERHCAKVALSTCLLDLPLVWHGGRAYGELGFQGTGCFKCPVVFALLVSFWI
ncbi:hypothetical protein VNO78_28819 [Psophocarpus tetragonolobus]|uniref:Uncharacterized protein n=1 Tax=Psophocarpus tetragonolobus TaxID=3891 RepID=A0AAN9RTY9_PSOTE